MCLPDLHQQRPSLLAEDGNLVHEAHVKQVRVRLWDDAPSCNCATAYSDLTGDVGWPAVSPLCLQHSRYAKAAGFHVQSE